MVEPIVLGSEVTEILLYTILGGLYTKEVNVLTFVEC